MAVSIHRFARKALPPPVFYLARQAYRRVRASTVATGYADRFPSRRDLNVYPVQPGTELHVFWKVLPIGRGPAFSLFLHQDEVLRFDCFGAGDGHFHASFAHGTSSSQSRIYLAEPNAAEQVARVEFELLNNLDYYLQRHPWRRIRKTRIDRVRLATATSAAKADALGFLDSVPDLAGLSGRADT